MIKLQNLTPQNYYKDSRDFQLFGRIYDVLFNYLKTNTLAITDIATNLNPNQKILELMCNTLGFKTKHNYNNEELSALCSIFLSCIKSKGSIRSIKLLLDMITSVENSLFEPEIIKDYDGKGLVIMIPSDIKDWTLIRDVMDYIMPAGSSYILQNQALKKTDAEDFYSVDSDVKHAYSWRPVSSAIIKTKEISLGDDPESAIINHNVKMTETGNATTGEVDANINNNLESMNSTIMTLPINQDNTISEENMKRISEKLAEATEDKTN